MNEKIKEVFSDEEFVKSLLELETPEEVQDALAEKDIDLSADEIKKIAEILQKKAEGELSEDELEEIAGGANIGAIVGFASAALFGSVVGLAVGITSTVKRRRW